MSEFAEYNPLDYENLTHNCILELLTRGPYTLPTEPFDGAGVYALFYTGALEPYSSIKSPDAKWPIYVGKAEPEGGRTGMARQSRRPTRQALFLRLREHASSIQAAENIHSRRFPLSLSRCYAIVDYYGGTLSDRALSARLESLPRWLWHPRSWSRAPSR